MLRSSQCCVRCRNHDVNIPFKGHKWYCQYRYCVCNKCRLTQERRIVVAQQTAARRAQNIDRERLALGLPVVSTNTTSPVQHVSCPSQDSFTAKSGPIAFKEDSRINNSTEMWSSIYLLLHWCGLPNHSSPLIHVLLKELSSDPESVYKKYKHYENELKLSYSSSGGLPVPSNVIHSLSSRAFTSQTLAKPLELHGTNYLIPYHPPKGLHYHPYLPTYL